MNELLILLGAYLEILNILLSSQVTKPVYWVFFNMKNNFSHMLHSKITTIPDQQLTTNFIPGDSWNCMQPILVPSSAKHIARQMFVIENQTREKILTWFVCDINRPSKELPVQSKLLKHKNKMWKLSRIKNKEDGVVPVSLLLTVNTFQTCLKSGSHLPKKTCVICLIETPLQIMKNALYFILKALFVLKIFKFVA